MKSFFLYGQRGVGLIEVLVTVLILGTSLLSIAALQARSLEQNHGAYIRTQANILAYDLLDMVRIIRVEPPDALKIPAATTVNAIAAASLPEGKGSLVCKDRLCTVTLTWSEANGTDPGGATSTFTYTSSL